MPPIQGLFEAHLTVANLKRAMEFYGGVLGLELASVVAERRVAFYWLGGRGKSMLGLWEVGAIPQQMSLHVAFAMELEGPTSCGGRVAGREGAAARLRTEADART